MIDRNFSNLNKVDVFRAALIMHIARLAIAFNMSDSDLLEMAHEKNCPMSILI